MRILFIGHNGYGYPHTRVRCYHFAKILSTMQDVETAVLSFRDDLAPHKSEAAMYENLRDREKLWLTWKGVRRLLREKGTVLYIQKAHFHAAAPYFLHRLGFFPDYIFDYDDYDIPLSNFFYRGVWNRLFFGTHRWDEITFNLARNARGCVAASHALLEVLQEHNSNVAYIPTGVDHDMFSPPAEKSSQESMTLLWNGLVWGEPILKNLRLLLKAYSFVCDELSHTRLLIVGGGAEWETLRCMIETEYSHVPIELKGWVEPMRMPELLRSVDVGLLPTDGDDLWLRSKSPTKLFEYMASGLPVIASNVGEARHVLEHMQTGYLARDVHDFAQGILRLVKNPNLRQEFAQRAYERVTLNYSMPVLGENLYLFLKKVLA